MASGEEIFSHSSIHSAEGDGGGKKDGIEEVVDLRTYHRLQAKRTIFGLDAVHLRVCLLLSGGTSPKGNPITSYRK